MRKEGDQRGGGAVAPGKEILGAQNLYYKRHFFACLKKKNDREGIKLKLRPGHSFLFAYHCSLMLSFKEHIKYIYKF